MHLLQTPSPGAQPCLQPQEPRNCTAHGSPARPQQASSIQNPGASRLVTKRGEMHAAFSQIPRSGPDCGASSWKLRPRAGLQSQGPQGLAIRSMQTSEKVRSPRLGSLETQSRRGRPPRRWVWSPKQGCPALLRLGRGQSLPQPGRYGGTGNRGAQLTSPHLFSDISLDADTGRTGKVKRSQGHKVGRLQLSQDGRVGRQTWGWS